MSLVELELTVPLDLSGIKLSQYQKWLDVAEQNKDVKDTDFLNRKALEIFCGVSLKETLNIPLVAFESALVQLSKCFEQETPLVKRFTLTDPNGDSVEFGFEPNLHKISFGAFSDLDDYIGNWKEYHKAMAVLFRPTVISNKSNYRIADYEGTEKFAEAMKDMPVNVALGAQVFFYRLGKKLSVSTIHSLAEQMKGEAQYQEKRASQESTDGMQRLTHWLKEMSFDSMMLPVYQYTKR
jgi:hypothetical protein